MLFVATFFEPSSGSSATDNPSPASTAGPRSSLATAPTAECAANRSTSSWSAATSAAICPSPVGFRPAAAVGVRPVDVGFLPHCPAARRGRARQSGWERPRSRRHHLCERRGKCRSRRARRASRGRRAHAGPRAARLEASSASAERAGRTAVQCCDASAGREAAGPRVHRVSKISQSNT